MIRLQVARFCPMLSNGSLTTGAADSCRRKPQTTRPQTWAEMCQDQKDQRSKSWTTQLQTHDSLDIKKIQHTRLFGQKSNRIRGCLVRCASTSDHWINAKRVLNAWPIGFSKGESRLCVKHMKTIQIGTKLNSLICQNGSLGKSDLKTTLLWAFCGCQQLTLFPTSSSNPGPKNHSKTTAGGFP